MTVWADKPFSFHASRYSVENLTAAKHDYELHPSDKIYLHANYAMSGVGSNSCEPELLEQYHINDVTVDWHFEITLDASV